MVLWGDPGVGETALLEYAAESAAPDFTVLSCGGLGHVVLEDEGAADVLHVDGHRMPAIRDALAHSDVLARRTALVLRVGQDQSAMSTASNGASTVAVSAVPLITALSNTPHEQRITCACAIGNVAPVGLFCGGERQTCAPLKAVTISSALRMAWAYDGPFSSCAACSISRVHAAVAPRTRVTWYPSSMA